MNRTQRDATKRAASDNPNVRLDMVSVNRSGSIQLENEMPTGTRRARSTESSPELLFQP
jgi:hypothetical protein